jgi:hypothetical protein
MVMDVYSLKTFSVEVVEEDVKLHGNYWLASRRTFMLPAREFHQICK